MRRYRTGLWKNSDFVKLWLGQTVSHFGSGITGIALPLTAVLVLAATPAQMGILGALDGVSVLVIGLLAGVWVDRVRRRTLLIATDLGRAFILSTISFLFSACCLGLIHTPEPHPTTLEQRKSIWSDLIEGLRMVLKNPLLRSLAGSAGIFSLFGNFVGALYALYVIRQIGAPPIFLG